MQHRTTLMHEEHNRNPRDKRNSSEQKRNIPYTYEFICMPLHDVIVSLVASTGSGCGTVQNGYLAWRLYRTNKILLDAEIHVQIHENSIRITNSCRRKQNAPENLKWNVTYVYTMMHTSTVCLPPPAQQNVERYENTVRTKKKKLKIKN